MIKVCSKDSYRNVDATIIFARILHNIFKGSFCIRNNVCSRARTGSPFRSTCVHPSVFSGLRGAQSLVICVMFCKSLFV